MLLLSDPIDEWLIGHLNEFDGLEFRDVRRGELELGESDKTGKDDADVPAEYKELLARLKENFGAEVADVRVTGRLTDSPACLALGEHDLGEQMRRIMAASGQPVPESKPVLEINPTHPLIQQLGRESGEQRFADIARVVIDQATLAEGRPLKDPASFVQRLNRLLLELD